MSPNTQAPASGLASVEPLVLLKISIAEGELPDVEQWKRWLLTFAPSYINSIDVCLEGTFTSGSGILLLTPPVAVWDVLRDNDAYVFVDYVTSHNLLLKTPPTHTQPGRRAQGEHKENIPVGGR